MLFKKFVLDEINKTNDIKKNNDGIKKIHLGDDISMNFNVLSPSLIVFR